MMADDNVLIVGMVYVLHSQLIDHSGIIVMSSILHDQKTKQRRI